MMRPVTNSLRLRLNRWRILVIAVVVAASCTWCASGLLKNSIPVDDFVEYWAAGKLFLSGQNPYSPQQIWNLERIAGFTGTGPLPMFNPPWTIPLIVPFSVFPYAEGRLIWMLVSLVLVVVSCDACWKLYGGDPEQRWFGWILGITFLPSLFVLSIGQIGPLIVAGITAFLVFVTRGKFVAAGVALLLVAAKPHLVFLLWPALLLWTLAHRNLRILLGFGIATFGMIIPIMIINPEIWESYSTLLREWPPDQLWITTTIPALIRQLLGSRPSRPWLEASPLVAAFIWLIVYWRRHHKDWEWKARLPMLMFVSLAATPYGRVYDQIILLPLVIQVSASRSRQPKPSHPVALGYFAATILLMLMDIGSFSALIQLWTIPAWYALYQMSSSSSHSTGSSPGEPAYSHGS